MRSYAPNLDKWGISCDRKNELRYLCRQYDAMRAKLDRIREGVDDPAPSCGNSPARIVNDPTGSRAIRAADSREARRVRAIEQAAIAADPALYQQIIANVARGVSYERMSVPCGRRQFYDARNRFFWELDQRI